MSDVYSVDDSTGKQSPMLEGSCCDPMLEGSCCDLVTV
jgi:hypothetical protein